jgi:hypothetical protein
MNHGYLEGASCAQGSGKLGIAVISPPLDEAGNSVRAQKAIADISNALGGNPLASKPRGQWPDFTKRKGRHDSAGGEE